MSPEITHLDFTYKKPGTEVWVLNSDDIPVDKSLIKDQQIIRLAPGSFGGNHKHPRVEWFIGFGELFCVWLDENGTKHEESMNSDTQVKLVKIPPFLPHAILNRSASEQAVLFELADDKLTGVEPVLIITP